MLKRWQDSETLLRIADKIRMLRIDAGYTSYERFAIEHDLGRKYYWMVEKGKAKISLDYLLKLLKIHKINPSDFFKSLGL